MPTRVLAREGIIKIIAKHDVVDFRGSHAVAPPAPVRQVRGSIHVLHAAGDGRLHLACPDLLRGCDIA